MGFSLGGILGGVGGFLAGGPAGAAAGFSIGNSLTNRPSSTGTAADPSTYLNIKIPGFQYPSGVNTNNLVTMPNYPTLPQYQNPYVNPTPVLQNPTAGEQGAQKAANQSMGAVYAMLDPTNRLQKNLANSQSQMMRSAFLQNLRSLQAANQQARGRGQQTFYNPETTDSSGLRDVMNNAYQARLQGQANAQSILGNVASQLGQNASTYGGVANLEQNRVNNYNNQVTNRIAQQSNNYNNAFNSTTQNQLGNYASQVNNILNALNLYRGNQAVLQPAQQNYQAGQLGQQASAVSAIQSLLGGNGGSNPLNNALSSLGTRAFDALGNAGNSILSGLGGLF